ncbi:GTP cyclohydrolase II [Sphaerotilus mobilis]|nr:GTP cyclohydrolase II [Sphaerotilus mobilis]
MPTADPHAAVPATDATDATSACVRVGPSVRMPTSHGIFQLASFIENRTGVEHLAIHGGDLAAAGDRGVLVRVHSECFTGDILGSLRCDCGPQLHKALDRIAAEGCGVVIYMRGHEGRGIGLIEKLRAYALQDQGLDTVDANLALGHPVDARRYEAAAAILQHLGVSAVRLMSNNPLKLLALQEQGLRVVSREPHEAGEHPENAAYLGTKRDRLGHLLGHPTSG